MRVQTHDEILDNLCDSFDSLIAPNTITRSRTNLLYLIFSAVAKGWETLIALFVIQQSKFDPANSSDEDLVSIGKLVGTEKLPAKKTALRIVVTNTDEEDMTIEAGDYVYVHSADVSYPFTLLSALVISPGQSEYFTSYSSVVGSFPVPAISKIAVVRTDSTAIPAAALFSCQDNASSLGRTEETNLAFRQRILSKTDRHDSIKEMEDAIKRIPSIFDAYVVLNQSSSNIVVDGITLLPFTLLITINGEATQELADVVAAYGFYPTKQILSEQVVNYQSSNLAGGVFPVYYNRFTYTDYTVNVRIALDTTLTNTELVEPRVLEAFTPFYFPSVRTSFITEELFYTSLRNAAIEGLTVLDITLLVGGSPVTHIKVDSTAIANLAEVTFTVDS